MRISDWSSYVCSSDLQQHVANGTIQTMKSKHLDGLAVDLVPWVGKPVWAWDRIYPIAFAMDQAATELGLASKIRWGGAWDRVLSAFGGSIDRKSVVSGKSVSVRVDLGGRRLIKKKK